MSHRETIFVNLQVLSQLREGQKLRVKRHRFWQLYNEESGLYRWVPEGVRRWLDSSSRHTDLTTIIDTYEAAMSAAEHLRKEQTSSADNTRIRLAELMAKSLAGLKMMQRTYSEDATMVSRIGHLTDRVAACVQQHGIIASEQLELAMLDDVDITETNAEGNAETSTGASTEKKQSKKKKKEKH